MSNETIIELDCLASMLGIDVDVLEMISMLHYDSVKTFTPDQAKSIQALIQEAA